VNQVLLDVLHSAVKAKGASPPRVVCRHDARRNRAVIVVEDNGPGLSKEELARIFEPGFTTKDGRVRAGYGLATAYLVVRDHGGSIHVECAPASGVVGTRVTIELPVGGAQSE
jgi:C4-dicarboxylate-specific signal transduction histidine kinase